MKISIFGLGYVGTVSAACLTKQGHTVIGVDINPLKVESINNGTPPIIEPGIENQLKTALASGQLTATTDEKEAISKSDLSFICVGTPSNGNGSLNREYLFTVAEKFGCGLKQKQKYHAIAIRSTVLPGTVDKFSEIIENISGKRAGTDFGVASNPEFMREGTAVYDFEHPPFTVVGASDKRIEQLLNDIYEFINAPFYAVKIKESELLKYACNSFHAVKVVFANEIGTICKTLGIDSHVVMKIFAEDSKLNISPYYLKPAFAFGGSCLPKDVRAITYKAKTEDIETPLLKSLIPSNELHIQRVIDWVIQKKKKKVGVLGLSFKSETDDLRESPVVKVVETLLGKGFDICIYDSNVNLSKLIGANKQFIEQEIPHIASLMKDSVQEILEEAEVIIISNKSREFAGILHELKSSQSIMDLVRITDNQEHVNGSYEGICW